jgi:hypothetical protein
VSRLWDHPDVQDLLCQEHAVVMQANLLSPSSQTTPLGSPFLEQLPSGDQNPWSSPQGPAYLSPPSNATPSPSRDHLLLGRAASYQDSPASVTFNQPLQAVTPRGMLKGRNRGASISVPGSAADKSKEVLNDIATQSKKGLSALLQRLGGDKDKERDETTVFSMGGDPDTGLQRRSTVRGEGGKVGTAMKSAKARTDADEAGEFNTLTTLSAAVWSLMTFIRQGISQWHLPPGVS